MWKKICVICNQNNSPLANYCIICGQPINVLKKTPEERARIYRKAAEQGFPIAQYQIGVCYETGEGVDENLEEAFKWYCKAAENNNVDAQFKAGVFYLLGRGTSRDFAQAVKWLLKADEAGFAFAAYGLGLCCEHSNLDYMDPKDSVQWYRKAADQGVTPAQYELGTCYAEGRYVPQNYTEAVRWFRKGADQGDDNSQYQMGVCYAKGHGVEKNYCTAVEWYRKSAEQGLPEAQYSLGNCYDHAYGTPLDYLEAVRWYQKAAEQGHVEAQYELGAHYKNQQGVKKDEGTALYWYHKAAEGGHAGAQYNLGRHYHYGDHVKKDYAEAVKWYRMAAEQGDASGQYYYGVLLELGEGVPEDFAEAVKWYKKAAEQDYAKARERLDKLNDQQNDMPVLSFDLCESDEHIESSIPDGQNKSEECLAERQTLEIDFLSNSRETEEDSLDALMAQLNSMVGLHNVKKEVQNRINRIRITKRAEQLGSKRVFSSESLHMVFSGNPGTGKTTVARLLGKIYGKLGVLRKPEIFIECGRDDLVSQYIGETAKIVKQKFEEARGGILFIDEAYSLYKPDDSRDVGHEAINTIVQYMDTMRDDIIVIMAGYRTEMERFIREANPGLASRFRTSIYFEDYTVSELVEIFIRMLSEEGMTLEARAKEPLESVIRQRSRRTAFGNARGVRNLFEDIKESHDNHLVDIMNRGDLLSEKVIETITAEDIRVISGESRSKNLDIEELLTQLDSLVGLRTAKQQIRQQAAIVQAKINAEKAGLTTIKGVGPQHMIFAGNPGTGKTTVARLVGKIYEALGLVTDSSIFVECGRSDLVGQYIGQTAPKVKEKVQSALGGILFIDEAYSLYQSDLERDFGREAISELVKEMENNRDNLIVIMAGYTRDMRNMINNANAGLKSRFPIWIDFEDYSVPEMVQIFLSMLQDKGYSFEGKSTVLYKLISQKSQEPGFGNGRGVRNVVDKVITAQSLRLVSDGYDNIYDPKSYIKIKDVDLLEVLNEKRRH